MHDDFSTPFGRFANGGAAYEITNPDAPRPWVNVISNGRYGVVVSHNGGGFSWLDHCQLNVITRWNMDLVTDRSGRFIYLRDLNAEETWSLTPSPCRPVYDSYRCTHKPGVTIFETEYRGVRASWEIAVAPDAQAEIWRVRLRDTSGQARRLRLGAFFEWCCGAAPDVKREFHRLFFTTTHDERRHAIVATKNMWEAPFGTADDHWNRPWPHAAALAIDDGGEHWATSDKEAFLGRYGELADPAGMRSTPEAKFGRFNDASAAMGRDITLPANGEIEIRFALAIDNTADAAANIAATYTSEKVVEAAITGASKLWEHTLCPARVKTDAADFDALNSTWLPYQAISARLWGRTGYYQQSGAFGFRDQLQDSQLWLALDPSRCLDQIMHHAAHQFADGSVYHWWNPLTETGLHDKCSDDYLWLPFIVASYVRETGDVSALERHAPFVDDKAGATLAEHGKRSIARSLSRFSERGLPLIGDNDWNDGLSHLGTDDKGESVWLAMFLYEVMGEFGRALELAGDVETAEQYAAHRAKLRDAVEEHAWDGRWYRRATDRDGRWLGSSECIEGRIFLNAQTWSILSNLASEERAAEAWTSAKANLLTDYGPLLLAPAYSVPNPKIGYLSRYAPGARENGGVYMHAATWALATACKRRDAEAVRRIWMSISPPRRGQDAEAYAAEPYVLPGNVDGPLSMSPGRAGWTWYTGSAAWLHRVSNEWVLGIRPTWDGLRIDPCPLPELGEVDTTRTWRDRRVRVRFDARDFDANAECVVTLNGAPIRDGLIREDMVAAGTEADVRVAWGGPGDGAVHVRTRAQQTADTAEGSQA